MIPRVLTIQDISCVGRCSLTIALPVLSACGAETCVLPTAVLSTHTGGFGKPVVCGMESRFEEIFAHWQREGVRFDAIYTGYLADIGLMARLNGALRELLKPGGKLIVDPAMADHGKLYSGFGEADVLDMRALCTGADVILPNLTEACLLTGETYREAWTAEEMIALAQRLKNETGAAVLVTGASPDSARTGILVSDAEGTDFCLHRRCARSFHGTGDLFASVFTGAWLTGKTLREAASLAGEFVARSIENTPEDAEERYGVQFETALPDFINLLH